MNNLYQETLSVFSIHELVTQLLAFLSASPPKIEAGYEMIAYIHRRADSILTFPGARVSDELIIKLFRVINQDLFTAFEDLVVHLILNGHVGIRDLHMNWVVLSQVAANHSYKILAAILAMDFPQTKWYIDRCSPHSKTSNIGMAIALAARINPAILIKWRKADYADKEWPNVVCKIQQVIFDCIVGNITLELDHASVQLILKKTPINTGSIDYNTIQTLYLALAQDDLPTVQKMTAENRQAAEIFSSHWLAENKALPPRCVVYLLCQGDPYRRQVCKKHFDWMFKADNLNTMQEVFRLNAIDYPQLKEYFEKLPSIQKLIAANVNVTTDYGDKTAMSLICAASSRGMWTNKTPFFQIVSDIVEKHGRQAFDPSPIQHPHLGYIPSTICIRSVHGIIDHFAEDGGYDLIKKTFSRSEIEDITRSMLRNTIFSPGSVNYDQLCSHINHLLV